MAGNREGVPHETDAFSVRFLASILSLCRSATFSDAKSKYLVTRNFLTGQLSCIYNYVMSFSIDHKQSLGYLTGIASRLLSNILAMRLKGAGINMTPEQWGAITILLNDGAMTQGQLGERLHIEKSSVSRLTDGLERRGWVERTKNPTDSRLRLVTATPKALDTALHCETIARVILKEAQTGMSEDEMLTTRLLLSRIIKNLEGVTK